MDVYMVITMSRMPNEKEEQRKQHQQHQQPSAVAV